MSMNEHEHLTILYNFQEEKIVFKWETVFRFTVFSFYLCFFFLALFSVKLVQVVEYFAEISF